MKKRLLFSVLMAFILFSALFGLAVYADSIATLTTDKGDYAPGEVAILTGSGFQAGERIDLSIAIDDPATGTHISDYAYTDGNADDGGGFVTTYTIPQEAAGMKLTATALGLTSQRVATVTFTDSVISVTITSPTHGSPITVTSLPTDVTIKFDYSTSTTGLTSAVASVKSATTTVATASKSLTSGSGKSDSITVTIPADTANGSYTVQVKVTNTSGTGAPNQTSTEGSAITVNVVHCPENNAPSLQAGTTSIVRGIICDAITETTVTVNVSDFNITTSDPDGDTVDVTFQANGQKSIDVTLSAATPSQSLTLVATDNGSSRSVGGCGTLSDLTATIPVTVQADVHTPPVNHAPTITAQSLSLGEFCTADGTKKVTVTTDDFHPVASDPDSDRYDVTFDGGGTSKEITLSGMDASVPVKLIVTDRPSDHDDPYCTPMQPLTGEYTAYVTANVHTQPINRAPILAATDKGYGDQCPENSEFKVTVKPSDFSASATDADGDDVTITFEDGSLEQPVTLTPTKPVVVFFLKATDNGSRRYDGPPCQPITDLSSELIEVHVTATVHNRPVNHAPVVIADDILDLGDISVQDGSQTRPISLADFHADYIDPDGDPADLSLSTDSVLLTLPADQSDGEVQIPVKITALDNPSDRDDDDCPPMDHMMNEKIVMVKAQLHRNHAPVLSAHNLDLGQVIGCLVGFSFQKTVSVTPASFGASATDLDGDQVTITADLSEVTLVGPGQVEATVTLTATDDPTDRTKGTCSPISVQMTVKVKAQIIYNFVGFGSPLGPTTTLVKQGSTVPVKFQLFDCNGTPITSGLHTIGVLVGMECVPDGAPTVNDAGLSGDDGIAFRYSAPNWIFNLKTNSTYKVGTTYCVIATLADGTKHKVYISIKK